MGHRNSNSAAATDARARTQACRTRTGKQPTTSRGVIKSALEPINEHPPHQIGQDTATSAAGLGQLGQGDGDEAPRVHKAQINLLTKMLCSQAVRPILLSLIDITHSLSRRALHCDDGSAVVLSFNDRLPPTAHHSFCSCVVDAPSYLQKPTIRSLDNPFFFFSYFFKSISMMKPVFPTTLLSDLTFSATPSFGTFVCSCRTAPLFLLLRSPCFFSFTMSVFFFCEATYSH